MQLFRDVYLTFGFEFFSIHFNPKLILHPRRIGSVFLNFRGAKKRKPVNQKD